MLSSVLATGHSGSHKQQAQSCVHMWVTCTHSIRHIHTCAHSLLPLMKPICTHGPVHTPPVDAHGFVLTHIPMYTHVHSHTLHVSAHLWTPTHKYSETYTCTSSQACSTRGQVRAHLHSSCTHRAHSCSPVYTHTHSSTLRHGVGQSPRASRFQ